MTAEIAFYFAVAPGLAAERFGIMDHRVVIDDRNRLEHHIQALAIIEQRDVMIGNAHRAGVDVEAGIELAMLGEAAQFVDGVAAADRDVTSAGLVLIFQHLDFITGAAHFQRRGQARQPRAQNQHRCALGIALQIDGAAISGLARETQIGHRLVHRRAARGHANHLEQRAPAHRRSVLISHLSSP